MCVMQLSGAAQGTTNEAKRAKTRRPFESSDGVMPLKSADILKPLLMSLARSAGGNVMALMSMFGIFQWCSILTREQKAQTQ